MLPPLQLDQAIAATIKEEWGRVLAILVKQYGDIQTAEDVLQEAVEIALSVWRKDGLPESPAAWLVRTAKNKAIDRLRRAKRFAELEPEIAYLQSIQRPPDSIVEAVNADGGDGDNLPDKRLELIFTCCHPALDEKSRTALTLRTLGGLTTEEIARAFLDKPATMAQRMVRAKKKIAATNIPFKIPEVDQLPDRLKSVLAVVYLVFNEGYQASYGNSVTRKDLCEEAIRLARIINKLMPANSEIMGLLALMLLHDSRRYTRQSKTGEFIPLKQQDRSSWDAAKIDEGRQILTEALEKQSIGPYQLQAAITALHAEASTWGSTDWPQISALYRVLFEIHPTPVVRINQAVAMSYSGREREALALLNQIEKELASRNYQPFYVAKSEIHARLGQTDEAKIALEQAVTLSENIAERNYLEQQLRNFA